MSDLTTIRLPPIRCAICDKLVDSAQFYADPFMSAVRIRVWCHGETDTMALTQKFMVEIGPEAYENLVREGGTAFLAQGIASPLQEIANG
jgi:hypothetical protein